MKIVKSIQNAIEKASVKRPNWSTATLRCDTVQKAIERGEFLKAVCAFSYTDDYAWDAANNYGKGEVSGETLLGYFERHSRIRTYVDCKTKIIDGIECYEISISVHSNLSYDMYVPVNGKLPKAQVEQPEAIEVTEVIENEIINSEENKGISLTVELNEELNGIELYFSEKPAQGTIVLLKENGFRWHKRGYWYAKQTPQRLMIAEGLQAALKEVAEDQETLITAEAPTPEVETEALLTRSECIDYIKENNIELTTPLNTWTTVELREYVRAHKENTELKEEIEALENVEYNADGKVKVKSIDFLWSESSYIPDKTTVLNYSEAEEMIKNAALHAPDNGCYDKTKFHIVWTNGEEYTGRLDIVKSDMFKVQPLKQHIESFAKHVINDEDTSFYDQETKDSYKHFIDTYSLEDEKRQTENGNSVITAAVGESGKVLDFSSRFKQKQEKEESEKLFNQFVNEIIPYMTREEQLELVNVYQTNNDDKIAEFFNKLSLKTAIRKAKKEILGQN